MNSDRFKFRVWDNCENWYIQFLASNDKEPFTYILADADGSGNTIDSVFNSGWHNPDDCVIEQCTGLRDKTGKLIFEGDVIKSECFSYSTNKPYTLKYKVVFHQMKFQIQNIQDSSYAEMICDPICYEVIGNIHEVK